MSWESAPDDPESSNQGDGEIDSDDTTYRSTHHDKRFAGSNLSNLILVQTYVLSEELLDGFFISLRACGE